MWTSKKQGALCTESSVFFFHTTFPAIFIRTSSRYGRVNVLNVDVRMTMLMLVENGVLFKAIMDAQRNCVNEATLIITSCHIRYETFEQMISELPKNRHSVE